MKSFAASWKQYVIVEGILELKASCSTPALLLKGSGRVDKLHDLLVCGIRLANYFS